MIANHESVLDLYSQFPYPSDQVGDNLIYDLAIMLSSITGGKWLTGRLLDLGCGTGHRLNAVAQAFPDLECVGLDFSSTSLKIGRALAEKHELTNIHFMESTIENALLEGDFDFVVSTGVLHHLVSPKIGFQRAHKALKSEGLALIWLYHSFGEFNRMLDRELSMTFSTAHYHNNSTNPQILNQLGIHLDAYQYGNKSAQHINPNQISLDVDAFLHPIVNTLDYQETADLFLDAGFHSSRCIGVNRKQQSLLIDSSMSLDTQSYLTFKHLNWDDSLKETFLQLPYAKRIRLIELAFKPTGFTTIGFKSNYSIETVIKQFR